MSQSSTPAEIYKKSPRGLYSDTGIIVSNGRLVRQALSRLFRLVLFHRAAHKLADFHKRNHRKRQAYGDKVFLLSLIHISLALGMEDGEHDLMKRKPRDDKEGIFAGGVGVNVALQGFFIGAITLLSYFIGHFIESGSWSIEGVSPDGMTMAFLTLSMTEMFLSLIHI